MEEHGDGFTGCFGDGESFCVELNGVIVVDLALGAQGEVQVKQRGLRTRGHGQFACGRRFFINLARDQPGGGEAGVVTAGDFHLEDFLSGWVIHGFGVAQEGDHTVLEGAEAAFDFTFCLGRGRDAMGDAEGEQRALELAAGIAQVLGGTGAEKAQGVGINGLWQAVGFKGGAEVAKMRPSGVSWNEAAGHDEARVIVHGE